MKNLTEIQIQELETLRHTGVLSSRIKYILIDRCLMELAENKDAVEQFNSLESNIKYSHTYNCFFEGEYARNWEQLTLANKTIAIQLFFSRNRDGKAIMPFLDKSIGKTIQGYKDYLHKKYDLKYTINTDNVLDWISFIFWSLMSQSLGFDIALDAATKEYLN
jgi:hypothetical protein